MYDLMPLPAEKGLKPKIVQENDDSAVRDLMPLPAEKGLKPFSTNKEEGCATDLMPLPAEKGLKPQWKRGTKTTITRFDAPSSRKRIETFLCHQ